MPSKLAPRGNGAPDEDKAVESGDMVRVHYTGRLEDDSIFDTSDGREALEFEAGAGDVIEGFDDGVMGMKAGETKRVVIPPEAGYGPWRPELLTTVERAMAGGQEVAVGMVVQVNTPEDEAMEGIITEVTDEGLTLDFNHPLAGKVLTFDITVLSIEPPEL